MVDYFPVTRAAYTEFKDAPDEEIAAYVRLLGEYFLCDVEPDFSKCDRSVGSFFRGQRADLDRLKTSAKASAARRAAVKKKRAQGGSEQTDSPADESFEPPTLSDMRQFAVSEGLDKINVENVYMHLTGNHWKDREGALVTDWRQYVKKCNR